MKFRKYDQAQTKFVNLDYRKILGEDSDVVIINDIIDALDLSKFEERYVEVGNPAYHPKAMVKIIIYGYYKGYFGGRPLHRNYNTDLGLRYLSNDDFPDHRTINLFRVTFKEEIADIFAQVVMLCKVLGMIGFENLAIDSQKIKANANVFQNKNLKGVKKEKERIEKQLLKLLEEEVKFPQDSDKIEKKKKKLKRRKDKLERATQILKEAGGEDDEEVRYNLTDPDSHAMTDKRGVKNPDYKAQNDVDDKYQIITGVMVTNVSSDNGDLFPMKEKSKENTGQPHKNTLLDCGYPDKRTYLALEEDQDTEYYVPDKTMYSSKKNPYNKWNFKYDENKDVYICPEGKELVFAGRGRDINKLQYNVYEGVGCGDCKVRNKCLKIGRGKHRLDRTRHRSIHIYPEDEQVKKMREKLETDEGKRIYRRRMATVEPVHGDMQKNRGFIQFMLRGLEKVNVEYNLLAIAHNIRKIILHGKDNFKNFHRNAINTA